MELITRSQQKSLLELLANHKAQFLNFQGVHYLDIGFKYVNRTPTAQLAIRIHVHEKKARHRLDASQILPNRLLHLPTDVIQSNLRLDAEPNSRDSRFNPLVGGIAIRNIRHNVLGTLGAIVLDRKTQTWVGISNHHVLVGEDGERGDPVTQPASTSINDIVGFVTRWNQELDCALCSLNNSRLISPRILEIPTVPTGVKEPLLGMRVIKSGRTTGKTYGIIEGVSEQEFTIIPIGSEFNPPDKEISAPGDSGSIWLDISDHYAVGLHYAGEKDPDPQNERAWAKKMNQVAAALDITF
ncbi:MAG TPA: hypothetical protein VEC37_14340 [Bacillota bacterium]|nr:hypothetical protein [Bacillota bacterium]